MIKFHYEIDFQIVDQSIYNKWVTTIIVSEGYEAGEVNYIFCNDVYLQELNHNYLNHNDLTDIISFDYSEGNTINGDIFISIERVKDNAGLYKVSFEKELLRVMAHGILHYCGYRDKTTAEKTVMRRKEEEKITMFHVKQF
ncbi:MAG: rRNA maturation RNase YbeY [Bacteroidota bacterium]